MKVDRSVVLAPALAIALAATGGLGGALIAARQAHAVECGSTANRAGCVGPGGAATYNKNTGQAHTAEPYNRNRAAPGTTVHGSQGNTATKAAEPGCAYVNGKRVCN